MRKKIMLSAVALLSSAVFFVAPAWDMNKLLKRDAFSIMAVEQEDFVLWNIRASFRILDWMSVWVRGENLLNQRYEINAGFPMPGANVIGGLNFEF